ncbi:hypothetical protein N0V83_010695 [Neocucurbitaria cava]|uniref:Uncharacterized protein n=1 Tax=Neocucurbitaria cava TaxID=798079 RepID=A0A9W9CH04_9PLEO|nr:hypothetical protein N0V83_010695 [Neocucurbitaria cava]
MVGNVHGAVGASTVGAGVDEEFDDFGGVESGAAVGSGRGDGGNGAAGGEGSQEGEEKGDDDEEA